MTTARELVEGSLRLIGQLAEGETPTAAAANDALTAMNQMIDSWSLERLSVFYLTTQQFTWPSGQASRTLGPTGNFVGSRPILVDPATYFKDSSGLSFGVTIINQQQYDAIPLKTIQTGYPQVLFVSAEYPDARLTVYPVPNQDLTWFIVSAAPLTQPASLNTVLAFPPGYLRAFRFNLACEVAAEFGVEPSPTVKRIADVSKRNLKRINAPRDVMSVPTAILYSGLARYNIYTDNGG